MFNFIQAKIQVGWNGYSKVATCSTYLATDKLRSQPSPQTYTWPAPCFLIQSSAAWASTPPLGEHPAFPNMQPIPSSSPQKHLPSRLPCSISCVLSLSEIALQEHRLQGCPSPCPVRASWGGLRMVASTWVLNVSKDGGSTASLSNLLWGLTTPSAKKCFLMFGQNFLCLSICLLPLVLPVGPTGNPICVSKSISKTAAPPGPEYTISFNLSIKIPFCLNQRSLGWKQGYYNVHNLFK